MPREAPAADVCLLIEGAYPYIKGGVSTWVHDLIRAHGGLSFHVVALNADARPREPRFELPANVSGLTDVALQRPVTRIPRAASAAALVGAIEAPLRRLLAQGGRADFAGVLEALQAHPPRAGAAELLNAEPAFEMLERMYKRAAPRASFLQYFWSWRSLVGGLCAVALAPLPPARVYHAISTGYAGLMLARAVLETGHPGLLTEHGIYTNERRIEIAMADWLADTTRPTLALEKPTRDLRDLWLDAFVGYSRACYECCDRIVTLYAGNQRLQRRDGAPPERLVVIPNGIDAAFYGTVVRDPAPRPPTVALIGRVVPIKDVKTFIRAIALLRDRVADAHAVVLGPTDEDADYHRECADMVEHLGLAGTFEFRGQVKLHEHLGRIDVIALTSLSEAQPLVLLEAGAAGVPSVATDVGSCREIIEGRADEDPPLGAGGRVTPLADPGATAQALAELLLDADLRRRCGEAIRCRTERYYSKPVVDATYRALYDAQLARVPPCMDRP